MNALPTIGQARKAVEARAAARDVALVWPDDWRRRMLVPCITEAFHAKGVQVTEEHVAQNISITLPGVPGPALDLLQLIPSVGGVPVGSMLRGLAQGAGKTLISIAPGAMVDGVMLGEVWSHEDDHALRIARFGLGGQLAYLVPEGCAVSEMTAYGQGLAARVIVSGCDPLSEASRAKGIVSTSYGLPAPMQALACTGIDQVARSLAAGAPIAGPAVDYVAALRAAGWTP